MVRYRRNFIAGGTFFFTVTLLARTSRAFFWRIVAGTPASSCLGRSRAGFLCLFALTPYCSLSECRTFPGIDADEPYLFANEVLSARCCRHVAPASGGPVGRSAETPLRAPVFPAPTR